MRTFVSLVIATLAFAGQSFAGAEGLRPAWLAGDSYQYSCNVILDNGFEIRAYCRAIDGQWIYNDFYRTSCVSGVANMNGYLTCQQAQAPLPAGSYQLSCSGCYVNQGYLNCDCRTIQGNYVPTSIYYPACQTPIANMNGQLTCN